MNLTLRLLSVTIAFVAATFAGVTACAQNIGPETVTDSVALTPSGRLLTVSSDTIPSHLIRGEVILSPEDTNIGELCADTLRLPDGVRLKYSTPIPHGPCGYPPSAQDSDNCITDATGNCP